MCPSYLHVWESGTGQTLMSRPGLKMTTFKIVFTFDVFLVLKPHALQGDRYFIYETGTFQSALLFTSTISDPMTVT